MLTRPITRGITRPITRPLVRQSSVFDPLTLFAQGQQGAWYDPSDLATLFQDAAGTIPVTGDGDPVGLMLDKSGNDNHASQSTTAAKPTYRTDGTLHWLTFDGVDDYLGTQNIDLSASKFFSALLSLSLDDGAEGVGTMVSTDSVTESRFELSVPHSGDRQAAISQTSNGTDFAYIEAGFSPGDTRVLCGSANLVDASASDRLSLRIDGLAASLALLQDSASTSGYYSDGPITLGNLPGRSYFFNGKLYQAVLIEDNLDDFFSIEQYLADKAGVTLP